MDNASSTRPVESPTALIVSIANVARRERHEHMARYAERPDGVVLVGHRLWGQLRTEAHAQRDLFQIRGDRDEIVAIDGTRFILAGIPVNEWRLAVLAGSGGSITAGS